MAQITLNSTGVASNGSLVLQSNGTTAAVTVDTSQNVGVGVTPSAWSTTKAVEVGSLGTALWSSGAGSTSLSAGTYYNGGWKYANGTTKPALLDFDSTGKMTYYVATATGTAGNAISLTQLLSVEAGKSLPLQGATSQTGTGITFPATQSASSDANTLDDYEEGTWTPTPDGNFTYTDSVFTGNYTKIGRLVNVNMRIVTTTGNVAWISGASVTGLPFTAATNRAGSWSNIANFTEGGFSGVQSTSITMITARTASADNFDVSVTYFV